MELLPLLANIASMSGAFLVILAYYLISSHKLTSKDASYQWMNLAGATLISCSLYHYWNIGTAIIEVVWIVISVTALWRIKNQSKSTD